MSDKIDTSPSPILLTSVNSGFDPMHTHMVPSHNHSIGISNSFGNQSNVHYPFESCDFVVGWKDDSCMILKNRYSSLTDKISIKKMITVMSKTLARSFLDDKMRLFEEGLASELETTINETLEKVMK